MAHLSEQARHQAAAATCPGCGASGLQAVYEVSDVPVNSVLLLHDEAEAQQIPTGDIVLGCCPRCVFITNIVFDGEAQEYSTRYESTQRYSAVFSRFAQQQARELVARYSLQDKHILEIGCGQGEFLMQLCAASRGRGTGFDPAYRGELPLPPELNGRVQFVQDYYSEQYAHVTADFVVCKMTLEHIPDTGKFVGQVRRALGDQADTVVFFQIPNAGLILRDCAFWDVYYEHCSYFTEASLVHLFRISGFEVLHTSTEYNQQYLTIEARPIPAPIAEPYPAEAAADEVQRLVRAFATQAPQHIAGWQQRLAGWQQQGKQVVLWGGGSKAVAFLTTLGAGAQVTAAVDINPNKHGTLLAGTRHPVIGPDALHAAPPDIVIVMNPIYCDEIRSELQTRGIEAEIVPITEAG